MYKPCTFYIYVLCFQFISPEELTTNYGITNVEVVSTISDNSDIIGTTTVADVPNFTNDPVEKYKDENDFTTSTVLDDTTEITTVEPDVSSTSAAVNDYHVRYDGYHILNVPTVNSKHRKRIRELEKNNVVEKLHSYVTGVHLLVTKEKIPEVKELLSNASMSYNILCNDLQRQIDQENPPLAESQYETRKGHRLTFLRYHRMKDVHQFLDYLSATRTDFVTVDTIGSSVENRPLKVIKISSGVPNATAMWIDGGIHAREWITVSSVLYILNELIENRDKLDKEIRNMDFYLLPLSNPDGYEYSHERERLWRKNRQRGFGSFCSGVDLNRNWPYEWGGKGASRVPCQETYAGSSAASEPEVKAITSYIMKNSDKIKGYVAFHSYGQYILYPWGYAKKLPADFDSIDRVGRVAAAAMKQATGSTYTVGNSAALLYPASGAADDWAKGMAKIKYSYTIELRDTGRYGFILPSSEIIPAGIEAFAAVKAIAKELDS